MPSEVGDATFGVRIETGGDPGLVAAMIAPLADADAGELEAQLIAGPVIIAEGLSHDEAMELVHACTRMGAEARLIGTLHEQPVTDGGTLVGASVAGLIEAAEAAGHAFEIDPAELHKLMSGGVHATQPFASADLRAALKAAVGQGKAPPEAAFAGHKTLALGSMNVSSLDLEASIDERLTPPGLRIPADHVVSLDPFAMDPAGDRKLTVPLLPAIDRPPPQVAPPSMGSMGGHDPLETRGMGSVGGGPQHFRLDVPAPGPTATGTVPRQARLTTSAPVPAAPPVADNETIADQSVDLPPRARPLGAEPRRFDLMEAAPASRGRPRMPTLNARPTTARRSEADHSPGKAAALSLVLPGMGQVYNGQFERGGWYALGALLIVPWVFSIVDAYRTAQVIRQGLRRAPDVAVRQRAVASQLALNLAVLFVVVGGLVLYRMRTQAARAGAEPATPASAAAPSVAPESSAPESAPASRVRRPIEVDLPIEGLMRKGKSAFARGLYAEAEEIMHAIIRRDPENKEAYRLLVEANSRRQPRGARPGALPGPEVVNPRDAAGSADRDDGGAGAAP